MKGYKKHLYYMFFLIVGSFLFFLYLAGIRIEYNKNLSVLSSTDILCSILLFVVLALSLLYYCIAVKTDHKSKNHLYLADLFKSFRIYMKNHIYITYSICTFIALSAYVIFNWEECTEMQFFNSFDGNNVLFLVWVLLFFYQYMILKQMEPNSHYI